MSDQLRDGAAPDTPGETPPASGASSTSGPVLTLFLVGAASMVAQGFGRFTYPVLLNAINDDVLGSYTKAGFLGTASLLAYLGGTALTSFASTRIEPVLLVRMGLVLSFAALAILTVAPSFEVLAIGLFIGGLGGAAVWVPAPGIAATVVGPERGGMAIGLVGAGIGMGIVVAGPLAAVVRATTDESAWRPVYGIQAGVALVVLLAVLAFVKVPTGSAGAPRVEISVLRSVPSWRPLLAAFSVFGLAYSLYFYFLVTQLEESGWSENSAGLVFALTGVASVFGGVVFGKLSDRYGRSTTMAAGFLLMTLAPVLTLVGSVPVVLLAAVAFGFCVAGTPTTIGAVVSDHLAGRAFGAAFGSLTFAFGIAQLIGPQAAGAIADNTGSFTVPFVVASAVAATGMVCAVAVGRASARVSAAPTPD